MNKIPLNIAGLDGGVIIKKGGGGGVTIKNQEKSVDITENGVTEVTADSGFTGLSKVIVNTNVATGGGASKWTGHADVEGLKAIGWTDEDIAYYQENGVNWNAEDDEYHKVTDDNKALYGVLTANNISTYKDRIVYLPKIDTSGVASMNKKFSSCNSLAGIPRLDTANVTDMSYMFSGCNSLVSIPQMETANVTNMNSMFNSCHSLVGIPQMDTSSVTDMGFMFYYCYSLVGIPQMDTQKVETMNYMFGECRSLVSIPQMDTVSATDTRFIFQNCYSLVTANLKNAARAYQFAHSALLSKESLLYIINNEAATSAITISLKAYAYTRLSTDADIVAALAAHPNISISQ